jgi:hypothetical protein
VAAHDSDPPVESHVTRSYVRVLIVWVLTLLALYVFQGAFS